MDGGGQLAAPQEFSDVVASQFVHPVVIDVNYTDMQEDLPRAPHQIVLPLLAADHNRLSLVRISLAMCGGDPPTLLLTEEASTNLPKKLHRFFQKNPSMCAVVLRTEWDAEAAIDLYRSAQTLRQRLLELNTFNGTRGVHVYWDMGGDHVVVVWTESHLCSAARSVPHWYGFPN